MKRIMSTLALLAVFASCATASPDVWAAKRPAMPTPPQTTQRQLIVDEFKRRLKAIDSQAPALLNGYKYQTDIGKNDIDEWATHYTQEELAAAAGKARLSVFDLVRKRTKDYFDQKAVAASLAMQVRAYHVRDLTPAELRKILADIQQAVVTNPDTGKRDMTLAGLATDIKPDEDGFMVPKETFQIDGAAVGFEVEHIIEPYGQ